MPYTVEHREDNLLQRGSNEAHTALLDFLNQFVIGQVFDDVPALQAVLATWPEKGGNNFPLHPTMNLNRQRGTIYSGSGVGGNFEIGVVRKRE